MKRIIVFGIALAASMALMLGGAFAQQQQDCAKSWTTYDLNGDGYLKGTEAKQFRDDMSMKGITVGATKDSMVSAKQYAKACETGFWQNLEQAER